MCAWVRGRVRGCRPSFWFCPDPQWQVSCGSASPASPLPLHVAPTMQHVRQGAGLDRCLCTHVVHRRQAATSPNVHYTCTGEVAYHVAGLCVVYNKASHTQRFFRGHDDDVMCLGLAPGRRIAASGQVRVCWGQRSCAWPSRVLLRGKQWCTRCDAGVYWLCRANSYSGHSRLSVKPCHAAWDCSCDASPVLAACASHEPRRWARIHVCWSGTWRSSSSWPGCSTGEWLGRPAASSACHVISARLTAHSATA